MMDSKQLLEKILNEWHFAMCPELENGVTFFDACVARGKLAEDHPRLFKFGEFLNDLEDEINDRTEN